MTVDFSKYYIPKEKQALAHKSRAKYLLYGGAMAGGKSWFLCAEAIKNAMMFDGNRLVIVRKELSVMRRTIVVTFFSICPPEIIKTYNQTSLEITFINGSVLTFIEANVSKDPLLQKLKGLEIGYFGVDEANEVSEDVYKILKTRLRWVLPNGKTPRYEGRLTSNPENCWLVPVFIQSSNKDEQYIQSLTTDNYAENSEYVLQLKEAFKNSPSLLKRYLLGDWTLVDSVNQLIPSMSIAESEKNIENGFGNSMGIDVARYGNDLTVFTILIEGNIAHVESHDQTSINEIVNRAIFLMKEYNIYASYVGVDSVGVGAGVVDNLRALGYDVVDINGGEKPDEEIDFDEAFTPHNLKSKIYWELRKDIISNSLGGISHPVLKQELPLIRYEILSDKTMRILPKEVLKKLIGKSPDYADSLAYANWVKVLRKQDLGGLPIFGGF